MSILTIGQAIATRLETISGLQVFSPDEVPDTINSFPCGIILTSNTQYHTTHDENFSNTFRVLILVSKQDQPSAMTLLIPFTEVTGTSSVKAAIEGDRTLGGTANDVKVESNTGMGQFVWGGIKYLGTEFSVKTI